MMILVHTSVHFDIEAYSGESAKKDMTSLEWIRPFHFSDRIWTNGLCLSLCTWVVAEIIPILSSDLDLTLGAAAPCPSTISVTPIENTSMVAQIARYSLNTAMPSWYDFIVICTNNIGTHESLLYGLGYTMRLWLELTPWGRIPLVTLDRSLSFSCSRAVVWFVFYRWM